MTKMRSEGRANGKYTPASAWNDAGAGITGDRAVRPGNWIPRSRQNESLEVRISVSNTADETERDGMRLFVDKLVEYSEVPLDISLFYEEDPEASLLARGSRPDLCGFGWPDPL